MKIDGKRALVTGASMGVGRAVAKTLAERGATVYAVARTTNLLHELAEEHPNIRVLPSDISSKDNRGDLVAEVGAIDILVNNAGMGYIGTFMEMTEEQILSMYETNIVAAVDLTHRLLPAMIASGFGHICNIGSAAGYVATPELTIYASTKFALQGFSDGLRREVSALGVKVSLITPGPIRTSFDWRASGGDTQDRYKPEGTGVTAEAVADAARRAIERDRMPGYQGVAVPRVMGAARLSDLPGARLVADGGAAIMRRFGWL